MEVKPIRNKVEILKMKEFLRKKGSGYELLFVMGLNTALRIGDLLSLKVADVTYGDGKIVDAICLKEGKTGKLKRMPINESLKNTLCGYLAAHPGSKRSAPLFTSRKGGTLSRTHAWRVLKAAGEAVGLSNIGTHTLRKTFGYHAYRESGKDIGLVQRLLNHSTGANTLRYIGIDREKMDDTYMRLNL